MRFAHTQVFVGLVLTLVACLSTPVQAQTNFVLDVKQGSYGVGLRVIEQFDTTRPFQRRAATADGAALPSERGRPMLTLVWYPARQSDSKDGGAARLNSMDYLRLSLIDDQFDLPAEEVQRKVDDRVAARSKRMPKETVLQELQQPTWAQRNATAAPGIFPVVIYAPGFGSPAVENAEMCEFLASQGYVVVASASMGSRNRSMSQDMEGLEAQVADIQFLITSAKQLPQADVGRVGVLGYSWGGLANVIAAARDSRIRALVSLDGAVRYVPAFVDGTASAARDVNPARMTTPLLFIAGRDRTIEALSRDKIDTSVAILSNMNHADVYLATMRPLRHFDFASQLLRSAPPDLKDEYSRKEVLAAYGWTALYVQAMFDAYLKGNASARNFLDKSAAENGSPAHMMSVERWPRK